MNCIYPGIFNPFRRDVDADCLGAALGREDGVLAVATAVVECVGPPTSFTEPILLVPLAAGWDGVKLHIGEVTPESLGVPDQVLKPSHFFVRIRIAATLKPLEDRPL